MKKKYLPPGPRPYSVKSHSSMKIILLFSTQRINNVSKKNFSPNHLTFILIYIKKKNL